MKISPLLSWLPAWVRLLLMPLAAIVLVFAWIGHDFPAHAQDDVSRTDPAETDTDGDGFTDLEEEMWGTDPLSGDSHPDLDRELVGKWELKGNGEAIDSSGNGLTGQLFGEPPPNGAADASGEWLTFDGVQNEVRAPDSPLLNLDRQASVCAWIKVSPKADGVVAGKWPSEGIEGSYTLALLEGRLVAELSLRGVYRPLFSSAVVADEQWHHVAIVYDGFEFRLYVDGQRVVTTHTGGPIDVTDAPLVMGHFEGGLRGVRVYGRSLIEGEVWLLHAFEMRKLGVERQAIGLPSAPPGPVPGVALARNERQRLSGLDGWGNKTVESKSLARVTEEGETLR